MDSKKSEIIQLFHKNVKGKIPDVSNKNKKHDGKEGHWLEQQFGIIANGNNEADLLGYELKNQTTSGKTTFGDWSANEYIFNSKKYCHLFQNKKDSFCKIFGKFNNEKQRYSWSGDPIPKINCYNYFGEILTVEKNLDVVILYSFSKDMRPDKHSIVPIELQQDNLVLAKWYGYPNGRDLGKKKTLEKKVEDKFNNNGWFTCKKNNNGIYTHICFGKPITFLQWIELVKEGVIFFDSGMHEGNPRLYSHWRANNSFWDSLIIECYE